MLLRTPGPSLPAGRRLAVALVAIALAQAGCRPAPEVSKYTAPKDPPDLNAISDEPGPNEPTVRVLGAIAPASEPGEWYFFKFQAPKMGQTYPPKAIERHAAEFEAFLRSLRFHPDKPPTWTVPAGWREVDVPTQFKRIATFRMRKSETTVDLAVSASGGSLLENINRWRGQVGAEPITEAEIDTKNRVLTVDGRRVVVVDVRGTGGKGGMMPPFAK